MARSAQQLEIGTRRRTAEGVSPAAVAIFQELLRLNNGDSWKASRLLLEPGRVTVGGRSLIPVEVAGLVEVSVRRPAQITNITLPEVELPGLVIQRAPVEISDAEIVVDMPGVGRNMDEIYKQLVALGPNQDREVIGGSVPQRRSGQGIQNHEPGRSTMRVSPEAVARVLNLRPERIRIQPIIDDETPGALKYGRVTIFPVQAVPANVAVLDIEQEPFWKRMGFASYREYLRDPLLVRFATDEFPDYPGLRDLIENANRALVNAVRAGVLALCDANLNKYLGDVLEGRGPRLDWAWQDRVAPMVAGIRMLHSSMEAAVAAIEGLAYYEFELLKNSQGTFSAFHPQELVLASAAVNQAYFIGMDVSRREVGLAVRAGISRESLKQQFTRDIGQLRDRMGFWQSIFDK